VGGLTALHCENLACYKKLHRALDLDGFFVQDMDLW
jgi:hypothetical protein